MKSPWIISPKGKLHNRAFYERQSYFNDLRDTFKAIENWKIKEARMIMSQSDWDDIVKFSKGSEE